MDKNKASLSKINVLNRKKPGEKVGVGYYVVLTLIASFMIIPLIWMISTSLKSPADVFYYPPKWIPDYHYIIEDGKKVEIYIQAENCKIEYITGVLKGTTENVAKNNIDVKWRKAWSPWDKISLVNISKSKKFPRWEEVKI